MKICVFAHTFPKFKNDGTAAFMEGFCEGLQKIGHQVTVLLPYDPAIKKSARAFQIITFKYIYPDKLSLFGYSRTLENGQKLKPWILLLAPFYLFFGFWALLRLVKKEKIELINAHWIVPGGFIGSLVSYLTGVPLLISAPGADIYLCKKFTFFKLLAVFSSWRSSQVIVAGSPLWIEDLAAIGINKDKLSSINYGVNVKQYYPIRSVLKKELGLKNSAKVILSVGRLIPRKGMDVLIKAIPEVVKKNPQAFFVIVGDGEQREELEFLAKKLKVFDHLLMVGYKKRDELLRFYNMCDLYVTCSNRDKEGTLDDAQIALIEAMACKKPVIASDLPGNKLVVRDEMGGYIFPQGDVKMLSQKINILTKDREKRKKFASYNLKLTRKEFSIEAVARAYSQFI